ncbi:uncharacterized protein LOC105177722 [Sesamum indicum]|uniref:Uncharacterized protein LOC105177722 n=1 Tax=Sesamum indicum TaxID=4182 RepID=A0A6I9UJS9_SESIN|nr:uncharacterized protein LOC105177722 [Sesamum indicum]
MDSPRSNNEFGSSHTEGGTYSGNWSYSSNEPVDRFCRSGRDVMLRTSWTILNPGRWFRGCPGDEGQYCSTFQWVDPPMCRRSKEIILGLLNRISEYETQMKRLNARLQTEETRRRKLMNYVLISQIVWLLFVFIAFNI